MSHPTLSIWYLFFFFSKQILNIWRFLNLKNQRPDKIFSQQLLLARSTLETDHHGVLGGKETAWQHNIHLVCCSFQRSLPHAAATTTCSFECHLEKNATWGNNHSHSCLVHFSLPPHAQKSCGHQEHGSSSPVIWAAIRRDRISSTITQYRNTSLAFVWQGISSSSVHSSNDLILKIKNKEFLRDNSIVLEE